MAGTSKQPPKSKTQIAFAQLVSTSIRLQTKQTRHSPHKYKGTLNKNKQRLYTQHHQRGSKQQTPTQNETTPQFRGCQTLLGKLEQSGKCQIYDLLVMVFANTTIFKVAVQQHIGKAKTWDKPNS